jgi:hypothetical protein
LESSNEEKTRAILLIEERFEVLKRNNEELKTMIQRLQDRLEAKKIVNIIADAIPVVGDHYIESWQP